MSGAPQQIPCRTCLRPISPKITISDKNGNQGKEFVSCSGTAEEPHAQWFRFVHTLTPSPTLPPTPQFFPLGQPITSAVENKCAFVPCKKRGFNKKCDRHACAFHCRANGGCSLNGHYDANTTTPTQATVAVATASTSTTTKGETDGATRPATSEPPATMAPFANPRFVSQLRPVFTEQNAREQALRQNQREQEAARQEANKKAKQTVTVCAWITDDEKPEEFIFQEGFAWPNFELTSSVLSDVGLDPGPNGVFHIYNRDRRTWQRVKVNHTLPVSTGAEILLKLLEVKRCLDLNKYFDTESTTPSHFRTNLQRERQGVNAKATERYLLAEALSSEPPTTRKRPSSSHGGSSMPKKARMPMPALSLFPPTPLLLNPSTPARQVHSSITFALETPPLKPFAINSFAAAQGEVIELTDSESESASSSPTKLAQEHASTPKAAEKAKDVKLRVWPSDYHVADIIHVLDSCLNPPRGQTAKSVFESMVHICWVPSTFYDVKSRWESASQEDRDIFEGCGYNPGGLWSAFSARVPLKNAASKAARQRQRRRDQKAVLIAGPSYSNSEHEVTSRSESDSENSVSDSASRCSRSSWDYI